MLSRLLSEGPKLSSTEPLKQPAAPSQSQPTGLTESTSYALPHNSHPSQATLPPHITQQPTWPPHGTLQGTPQPPQSTQAYGTQLPPPYTASNAPVPRGGVYSQQGAYSADPNSVGYGGQLTGGTQPPATTKPQRWVF